MRSESKAPVQSLCCGARCGVCRELRRFCGFRHGHVAWQHHRGGVTNTFSSMKTEGEAEGREVGDESEVDEQTLPGTVAHAHDATEEQTLPGPAPGTWSLRRKSLEAAHTNILALEKAAAENGVSPVADTTDSSGNVPRSRQHWQQIWTAAADSPWERGDAGSGSDDEEYWTNRVTEESQSVPPTEEELRGEGAPSSTLSAVVEEDQPQPLAPLTIEVPGPTQQSDPDLPPPTTPGAAMAGLAMAKNLAERKKRQIVQSTFKVKRGSLGRAVSREPGQRSSMHLRMHKDASGDLRSESGELVKTQTATAAGRGHSGLSALFVAGDGDITMEMNSGSHGQLEFESGRRVINTEASSIVEAKQAKFVRLQVPEVKRFRELPPADQQARVRVLRELADFIRYAWRLKVPSVIYSVTGSATSFTLRPKYQEAFAQSLLHATRNTNAWVFTGGTNQGVMKLVGDALGDQRRMETVIAVATWGVVHGRTDLDKLEGDDEPRKCLEHCTVEIHGLEKLGHENAREDRLSQLYGECGVVVDLTVGLDPDDPSGSWETSRGRIICYITFTTEAAAERACENQVRTRKGGPASRKHLSIQMCTGAWSPEDKGIKGEHAAKILASRGSVALPYVYKGKRTANEGVRGASLDRNHSHYLLVDDGSEAQYSKETEIMNELIQFFSFRDDMMTCSSADLTNEIRKRPRETKRSIPVVCLVHGGGMNSVQVVMNHIECHDPILIIRESGRAADLLSEWKLLSDERRRMLVRGQEPWQENAKMRARARSWMMKEVRRWRHADKDKGDSGEDSPELQAEIDGFITQLDRIVEYPDLHFVDVSAEDSKHAGAGAQLDKASTAILPTVLQSIANSSTVTHKVKLPLAIRYNDTKMIKQILRDEGLTMKSGGDELSADARPLLFAVFYDQADIASELLDCGFDMQAIDQLILLELNQNAQMTKLDRLETKKEDIPCPPSWEEQRRHEISLSATFVERAQWEGGDMSTEDKYEAQMQRVRQDWKEIAREQQLLIAKKAASAVTWDKLPLLPGWSFQVIARVGQCTRKQGESGAFSVRRRLGMPAGNWYQLKSTKLQSKTKSTEVWVKLVSAVEPFETYSGRIISPDEAKKCVMQKHTNNDYDLEEVLWDKYLWILVDEECVGQVLLKQVKVDEVSSALVINSPGRWPSPQGSPDLEALYKATKSTMAPWYSLDEVEPGVPWWQHLIATEERCTHRVLETGLSPLLRVFWAIVTERNDIADLLYNRLNCGDRFVSAFLCSWTYRKMNPTSEANLQLAMEWDKKATQNLLQMEIGGKVPACVFDEFVYFGLREEEYANSAQDGEVTQYAMLSPAAKRQNALLRSALLLMGCHPQEPKTRVDLAILSENKAYMAQRSTQQFLRNLWVSSSWNGKWSDSWTSVSPRQKWMFHTLGWVVFLLFYWYVYVSMPYVHSKPPDHWYGKPNFAEVFFWSWVLTNINGEIRQATDDFDSFRDYRRGTGNGNDMIIIFLFVLAFSCRVLSLAMIQSQTELGTEGWQLCSDAVPPANRPWACSIYSCNEWLLGINYIFCIQRLLLMLTIYRRIGVLYEIILTILQDDVGPFLIMLLLFIWSFEVAAHFFSWTLGERHLGARQEEEGFRGWFRGFGTHLSVLGLDTSEYSTLFDVHQGLPTWDIPNSQWLMYRVVFQIVFFFITVIVLMNLLIAM